MSSSFVPSSVYDKINKLYTQIIGVYSAFIQHTKYFFINSTDAKIDVPGDIYLISNNNTIYLNNNNLSITYGDILPDVNNFAFGSLFILTTTGDLYIKQNKNDNINWYTVQTNII